MQNIIEDTNGTLYCNLYNYENTFCWFLSTLHKLHSSKTLNKALNQADITEDNLLRPLQIYATLRRDNYVEVYEQIKLWFEYAYQYVFHEDSRHGHDPTVAFYYIYLPLIHHHFRSNFQDIINELNVEYINTVESTIHSTIYNRPVTKYQETFYNYYIQMINDNNYKCRSHSMSNDFVNFTAGIITVSPNKGNNNLHAITMIKTKSNYVILDDHNAQKDLAEYIKIHSPNHLYTLTIKDISSSEINRVNIYLHQNGIQEQFWSTVYGYKIKFEQKHKPKILGGSIKNNILIFILGFILIILIIIIIVMKNKKINNLLNIPNKQLNDFI